ncbi:MAG: 4-hydroxybutyrate dehydrogenase [Clostridiales Family XIII bacterium]|jgi:4-hydroxybutyrate dehydrogenase|nr:4-hydroxybutyrate dehydrogenase [Clostridiales Family XIII bacterium]
MQALKLVPTILYYDTLAAFHAEYAIGERDLVVTNEWLYTPYIVPLGVKTNVVFQEKYGMGEPSDEMIDGIVKEAAQYGYDRIIAFGGGTILDICKVLALKQPGKSVDLFTGAAPLEKEKTLICIPTTCGTGSEVTNVAIAELKSLHVKKGIAAEETFADLAVLIPETMKGLPDRVFATSSVDALIHCIESYLSPKASPITELFSKEGIRLILEGYKAIVEQGEAAKAARMKEFVYAAVYGGIAFGNAGCAAVHALSYSIGGAFHVPHGEANYQFFTEVMKTYAKKAPGGRIKDLADIISGILGLPAGVDVYVELDTFLGKLIAKKPLREYGMTEAQIDEFTKSTVDNQQRLLGNNYVPLEDGELREIFVALY